MPAPRCTSKILGLFLLVAPVLCAQQLYNWSNLPDLPEPLGVAGPFAGASNDALIVAGGAHFRVPPFDGGTKIWTDAIYVYDGEWREVGKLSRPLAYGISITTANGVVCIGGSDSERHHSDVFRLRWMDDRITRDELPSLPIPLADAAGAKLGSVIYVAGGTQPTFLALDLAAAELAWQALAPWPGPARILPAAAAQDGAFYLISGAELIQGSSGNTTRRFLTDAYRYRPGEGWKRVADVPRPTVAAPAIAEGQTHIIVFGGDDGENFFRQAELRYRHPGFPRDLLAYHTITDTWTTVGEMPIGLVTTTAARWRESVIIPSGEDRPGHRSPQVLSARLVKTEGPFAALDYAVMVLYLGSLVFMGLYLSRRGKGTEDFFLAGRRIPWWAAGLSIYGTQLSAISFMAAPGKVYATDWVYFNANIAIVLITPLVVSSYLPFFRRLNVTSAYEYLEKRFNLPVRLFASVAFILYQLGRMAIVLFLPAIALATVTGINVYVCILVMGLLCTFYTVLGGMEAVIWTDVLQVAVLLGGAMLSLALIAFQSGGFGRVLEIGIADDKFRMANWTWDYTTAAVWVVLIGNMFANLGPYTSDQTVVQRYLTTKDEEQAARSIWTNAAMVIPGTVIWFGLGTALYAFYKSHPEQLDPSIPTDAIFPLFIAEQLPAGVSGLIIAAIFAASMSTLDSSLNSVSTAVVTDFFRRFRTGVSDAICFRFARWLTGVLGIVATSSAILLATFNISSLWDAFQMVMGLFGGALAGLFALGIFTKRTTGSGALLGAVTSAIVLYLVQSRTDVHFFLYAVVGVLTCLVVGYIASLFLPARDKDLVGLTIYTRG